jgi:hypothetical protein
LREGAIHAAEGTLDLAEVANFFSQRHIYQIAIIISQYEILSRFGLGVFAVGWKASYARTPSRAAQTGDASSRVSTATTTDERPASNSQTKEKASAEAEA